MTEQWAVIVVKWFAESTVDHEVWVQFLLPQNFFSREPAVLKICLSSALSEKEWKIKINLSYVVLKGFLSIIFVETTHR